MSPRIACLWLLVAVLVATLMCIDSPTEQDAAVATSLDLSDAIADARTAQKDKQ